MTSSASYDPDATLLNQYMTSRIREQSPQKGAGAETAASPVAQPSSMLTETETYIRLTMDLPGVGSASNIQVDLQRGVLLIRGVRNVQDNSRDANEHAVKKHKFARRFAIDTDVV